MTEALVTEVAIEKSLESALTAPPPVGEFSFDLMYLLRLVFYVIVFVKLIEISFLRRKKHSLKERVYRKFVFAHQELFRQFTEEDKTIMDKTLNNTIKNAAVQFDPRNSRIRKSTKSVSFETDKNNYYEPRDWMEESRFDPHPEKPKEEGATFEEKKLEEEFSEREDLLGLNEKSEELGEQESKLSAQTQS
jgi:hypothetical protein